MIFLCKWVIFRFHVHFQRCIIAAHDRTSSKVTPPERLNLSQQAPEGSKTASIPGVWEWAGLTMFIIFYFAHASPCHIFCSILLYNSLDNFNINGEIQPIPVIILMIIEIQVGFEIGR